MRPRATQHTGGKVKRNFCGVKPCTGHLSFMAHFSGSCTLRPSNRPHRNVAATRLVRPAAIRRLRPPPLRARRYTAAATCSCRSSSRFSATSSAHRTSFRARNRVSSACFIAWGNWRSLVSHRVSQKDLPTTITFQGFTCRICSRRTCRPRRNASRSCRRSTATLLSWRRICPRSTT